MEDVAVALEPGMEAPEFELPDATGKRWRLGDLRGRKVIVYFYPVDDTPGCTAQACDFRDSQEAFRSAGYVVLGVSPQGAGSHTAFSRKYDLNFPLLIDEGREVAAAYGTRATERSLWRGIPLTVKRSTFVIDEDGKIEHAMYRVKARGHVERLRETLGL
jgi:peroxiredoxin Q/BCP